MKKNPIFLLLLLILFISLLASTALAESTTLEVKPPTGAVSAGSDFSLEVALTGNPGFSSIQFTLAFDSTRMQCTEIENGPLLNGMLSASNPEAVGGAKIAAAAASNRNGDGVIATFSFKALTDLDAVELTLSNIALSNEIGESISCSIIGATPSPALTPSPTSSPMPTSTPVPTPTPTPTPTSTPAPTPTQVPTGGEEMAVLFSDAAGHWGEEYISRAASRGLFAGYPDGSFHPDEPITRAQFMAVLYRAAGSPSVDGNVPFRDIDGQSEEFQNAIVWGYTNGYISGRSDDVFDPTGYLTRQEAMKILFYRAGAATGMEMMLTAIYDSQFPDSIEIADWAKPAMYWAIYHEIISGSDIGLEPGAYTTRAQMSKILVNYLEQNE